MLRFAFLIFSCFIFLISCSDDDSETTETPTLANFNIKVGNSWTYNYFKRIQNTEEFEQLPVNQTITVTNTETIGDDLYFVLESIATNDENGVGPVPNTGTEVTKVKDSLGYLVDLKGLILFSSNNTTPFLISDNEWGVIYQKLLEDETILNTDIGTFSTRVNQRYAILSNGEQSQGSDFIFVAEDTGVILEYFSTVLNPLHIWEKRLVSFESSN